MILRSPPLFWRTLLLVLLLIVASLAAWLQSFRVFERAPRAETVAQQIVSIAQLTRAALLYADPYDRGELLAELARNEGIRIFPLEPADVITPLPDRPILQLAAQSVSAKLGPGTRVVAAVNGTPGLWVSLAIDEDRYWLLIDTDGSERSHHTTLDGGEASRACGPRYGERRGETRGESSTGNSGVPLSGNRSRRGAPGGREEAVPLSPGHDPGDCLSRFDRVTCSRPPQRDVPG